jgi:coat protein Gp5
MANAFNVHAIVANEALYWFENEMVLGNLVHRGFEQEWRTMNGHKIGDTITVDRPARFISVDGPDITGSVQDVVYGSKEVKLNIQKTVPFKFDSRGLTTEADIKRVGEESIRGAASRLVQDVESSIAGLYTQISNLHGAGTSGAVGTPLAATAPIGEAGAFMTDLGVGMETRNCVVGPTAKVGIAESIKTLYMPKAQTALEKSKIGPIHNFDTYESSSLARHTCGDWAGSIAVDGASQSTTFAAAKDTWTQTLHIDGFTTGAAALKAGDVFTIADLYEVNPGTLQSTGRLRRFTVVSDAAMSSNEGDITITPPIIPVTSSTAADKANATVTAAVANDAVVTPIFGTTPGVQFRQHLAFHKNAMSLVMRPLQRLESFTVWETRQSKGLSLTLSKGGDIYKHEEVWRLDALFGVTMMHPDLAQRLSD